LKRQKLRRIVGVLAGEEEPGGCAVLDEVGDPGRRVGDPAAGEGGAADEDGEGGNDKKGAGPGIPNLGTLGGPLGHATASESRPLAERADAKTAAERADYISRPRYSPTAWEPP